jgi:hypothetical protein
MYITDFGAEIPLYLCVCFGKVKSDARSDQLITFTRFFGEALPIKYRDLPAAALNQARTFQLSGSIRDGWPLNTQHFGEKVLGDQQRVLVTAVTHHEQPTRQSLLEAVCTVVRHLHQDLLEKGGAKAARDILAALPGIWTKSLTEDVLAPKKACIPVQPSRPIVAISMTLPSA